MNSLHHKLATCGLAAVIAIAVRPSDGEACSSRPSGSHYYAIIDKENSVRADHGAAIDIDTNSLSTGAPGSEFVDHEMWYGVDASGKYWVEVGVTDGAKSAGGSANHAIFWARNRRDRPGYKEYYPSVSWHENAFYTVSVTWAGNDSWNVYFGGVKLGVSHSNYYGGAGRTMSAGLEATRAKSTDHVGGTMRNYRRKDGDDHWYTGWDGSRPLSYCPADVKTDGFSFDDQLHGPI
jgi:hypothetical protein